MHQPERSSSEAYRAGRHAGRLKLAPALNPHTEGSAEYSEWQLGWQASADEAASHANAKIYRDRLTRWDGDARSDRDALLAMYGRAA